MVLLVQTFLIQHQFQKSLLDDGEVFTDFMLDCVRDYTTASKTLLKQGNLEKKNIK